MKKWAKPNVVTLNSNNINSGNPTDVRRGEYVAYSNANVCLDCVPPGGYYIYDTGKIDDAILCIVCPGSAITCTQVSVNLLEICS